MGEAFSLHPKRLNLFCFKEKRAFTRIVAKIYGAKWNN